jgi:hypothetical protein
MWGNTAAKQKPYERNTIVIHNVFFKKNYETKFSISSIFKNISKDNFKKT